MVLICWVFLCGQGGGWIRLEGFGVSSRNQLGGCYEDEEKRN